jgi:hypothetical protein
METEGVYIPCSQSSRNCRIVRKEVKRVAGRVECLCRTGMILTAVVRGAQIELDKKAKQAHKRAFRYLRIHAKRSKRAHDSLYPPRKPRKYGTGRRLWQRHDKVP